MAAVPAGLRPRFVGGHPICGIGDARRAERARRAVRRRDLVPDAGGRDRPARTARPAPAAWPRSAPRRSPIDAGAHDRLVALTSHLPHALANLLVDPGRRGAHRRPRPAHGDRRLVPRHDARGRRQPAHLGRHLPRQPRGAGGGPARAPALAGRGAGRARGGRRGLSRALDRPGLRPPPPRAGRAVRPASRGALPRARARARPARACSPASRRRSAPRASTSRTSSCTTSRPSAAARSSCSWPGSTPPSGPSRCSTRRATGRSPRPAGGRHVSAATGADRLEVAPAAALVGELSVPGDKSISHRALLIGAVCDGTTEITGFGANADTLATLAAVESLGARVERLDEAGRGWSCTACGLRGPAGARRPDRRPQRGHADAAAAGPAGRAERHVHARRRRVDPPPPGRPRGRCRCG